MSRVSVAVEARVDGSALRTVAFFEHPGPPLATVRRVVDDEIVSAALGKGLRPVAPTRAVRILVKSTNDDRWSVLVSGAQVSHGCQLYAVLPGDASPPKHSPSIGRIPSPVPIRDIPSPGAWSGEARRGTVRFEDEGRFASSPRPEGRFASSPRPQETLAFRLPAPNLSPTGFSRPERHQRSETTYRDELRSNDIYRTERYQRNVTTQHTNTEVYPSRSPRSRPWERLSPPPPPLQTSSEFSRRPPYPPRDSYDVVPHERPEFPRRPSERRPSELSSDPFGPSVHHAASSVDRRLSRQSLDPPRRVSLSPSHSMSGTGAGTEAGGTGAGGSGRLWRELPENDAAALNTRQPSPVPRTASLSPVRNYSSSWKEETTEVRTYLRENDRSAIGAIGAV
eukprot:Hpha_TRINITY_DN1320_c0_g1::TRINITY_DN1320_c0_g1_i1::g.93403::m.93403